MSPRGWKALCSHNYTNIRLALSTFYHSHHYHGLRWGGPLLSMQMLTRSRPRSTGELVREATITTMTLSGNAQSHKKVD